MPTDDPDELRTRVARRIVELREASGLTQRQVAEAIGLDPSSYARMESGSENLTLRSLALIAAAFDLPTIVLFEPPKKAARRRSRGRPRKET